jgi:hypothetical protein
VTVTTSAIEQEKKEKKKKKSKFSLIPDTHEVFIANVFFGGGNCAQ